MRGSVPPLPQYVFMARCLVKPRDNFIFYLCIIRTGNVDYIDDFSCLVHGNHSQNSSLLPIDLSEYNFRGTVCTRSTRSVRYMQMYIQSVGRTWNHAIFSVLYLKKSLKVHGYFYSLFCTGGRINF
jgi:hypothetical protein